MNVSIVNLDDATALCSGVETAAENFYDIFGTVGCSLTCSLRREYQETITKASQPGLSNSARMQKQKEIKRRYKEKSNEYFTLSEVLESIQNGCGSCKVLQLLFVHVGLLHPTDREGDSNVTFNVTHNFILKRRSITNSLSNIQQISLFSPVGNALQFRSMPRSSFLCGNTDSDQSIMHASDWLKMCVDHHVTCVPNTTSPLPSRLIDVTNLKRFDMEGIKLVLTADGQTGKYACLSHCWGTVPIRCCTITETLESATEFIEWNTLPQNFQDAIIITRRLGIQYIWIDSMCIVQNDRQDWAVQSAEMASIYKNSYITIAASASADSTGGCFSKTNPDICLRITLDMDRDFIVGARMCDTQGLVTEEASIKKRRPLLQRAWVYQERLLSTRTLNCNYGELAFRCLEGDVCECGRASMSPHTVAAKVLSGRLDAHLFLANAVAELDSIFFHHWRDIVSKYMRLNLTHQSDLLPAISGCARIVAEMTGDEYFAGVWKKSFAHQLLWINVSNEIKARADWRAPTWSWASVPSGQDIRWLTTIDISPLKHILHDYVNQIYCKPKAAANSFGELLPGSGSLTCKAELFPCFIRQFCYNNLRTLQTTVGPNFRRPAFRLHQQEYRNIVAGLCDAPAPGIHAHGSIFVSFFDIPVKEALQWQPFHSCAHCELAQIWLLHAGSVLKDGLREDIFIMLRAVDTGMRTYERFGVTRFERNSVSTRKEWFQNVWTKDVLPEELITIN